MTRKSNEPNPQDLSALAKLLRKQRPQPTELQLDAVKQRALRSDRPSRGPRVAIPARTRVVVLSLAVLGLAIAGPSTAGNLVNAVSSGKNPFSVTPPAPAKATPSSAPANDKSGSSYLIGAIKTSMGNSNGGSSACKDDKYGKKSYYCQNNTPRNCNDDKYGIAWYYCQGTSHECEQDKRGVNKFAGNSWYFCDDNDDECKDGKARMSTSGGNNNHCEPPCPDGKARMSTSGGSGGNNDHCDPCPDGKARMSTSGGNNNHCEPPCPDGKARISTFGGDNHHGDDHHCMPCKDPKGQYPDSFEYCPEDDPPDHCKDDKYGSGWWYCHKPPDNCKNDKYGNAWYYCHDDEDDCKDGKYRMSTSGGGKDDCKDDNDQGCKDGKYRMSTYGGGSYDCKDEDDCKDNKRSSSQSNKNDSYSSKGKDCKGSKH